MPQIDMPLEQLYEYRGRNPKPADFDAYWERGLAEMRALDADVRLEPAAFRVDFAECFDLTFTGVGGARVYAKYVRPNKTLGSTGERGGGGIVQFHGYSMRSADWHGLLGFAAAGHCVAAMDCRGQAGRSEDVGGVKGNTLNGHIIRGLAEGPEALLFRHIFLDAAQLAGIVMGFDEVDADRVGVTGGSQGGGLTLACAALEPRVRLAAAYYPFLCDYQRVWEMDLARHAYEELRVFFRHFDPLHERETEWFTRLGYIDVQHLADRIRAEVMMGCSLMDNVCPPSTQFAAYNKMACEKNVVIYPDFGHEGLPGFGDKIYQFLNRL